MAKHDDLEKWADSLEVIKTTPPPRVGVRIECRIIVDDGDWEYVRETLENCRQYGSAAIVGYVKEEDL